jgi:hypothetical protein
LSSWHAKSASGVDRILYKSVSILWYRPNKCVFDVDRYIFQEDPDAKKVRLANFKEEHREEGKFGAVKLQQWRKQWK